MKKGTTGRRKATGGKPVEKEGMGPCLGYYKTRARAEECDACNLAPACRARMARRTGKPVVDLAPVWPETKAMEGLRRVLAETRAALGAPNGVDIVKAAQELRDKVRAQPEPLRVEVVLKQEPDRVGQALELRLARLAAGKAEAPPDPLAPQAPEGPPVATLLGRLRDAIAARDDRHLSRPSYSYSVTVGRDHWGYKVSLKVAWDGSEVNAPTYAWGKSGSFFIRDWNSIPPATIWSLVDDLAYRLRTNQKPHLGL